jgi:arylsulfatase A-like enzyme
LLTVGWSPLYQEITRVPLIARVPGMEPGRRSAMTTAPDLTPTILELTGVERPGPEAMQGRSFAGVLTGRKDEHRPFVVSSWPLYFAEGEMTTAVDSRPRRIASYMPITITTPERSVILGGPTDTPEMYDLTTDPHEQVDIWDSHVEEGRALIADAISFMEEQGAPAEYLEPRRQALKRTAADPEPVSANPGEPSEG